MVAFSVDIKAQSRTGGGQLKASDIENNIGGRRSRNSKVCVWNVFFFLHFFFPKRRPQMGLSVPAPGLEPASPFASLGLAGTCSSTMVDVAESRNMVGDEVAMMSQLLTS
jgi:hypothetical protein